MKKGGRCTGAEIPLQAVGRRQADPLQPMEANGGVDAHMWPVKDPILEWVNVPKEGQDFLQGNPALEKFISGRTTPCGRNISWNS